ncbi:hypothetical protein ABPG77_002498 [Micractinium sp. CCAP 211/92]
MAEYRKWTVQHDSERSRIADPPGFDPAAAREQTDGSSSAGRVTSSKLPLAKRQEALQHAATAPFKQVAMLCFMMWMSGSTLHLFSIMTTLSGIYQPLSAILKAKTAFPPDPEGELNTTLPRLTYCAIHGLGVAFAVYKINSMGLLPTHLSDWLSSMRPPTVLEHAAGNLLR